MIKMCYNTELQNAQPQISRFIYSKIYNKSDAKDVIQNTNHVLINKRKDFKPNLPFMPWAMRIANLQIKAYLTSSKRNRIDLYDEEWKMDEIFNHNPFYKRKEKRIIVKEIINKIKFTKREKEVICLCLKSYKNIEIADVLNIHAPHVSAYRKRGIKKIKSYIEENKNKL
tara:strand:- start:7194 stop:7703 length:510 start_codon:yes stop_codon:yes gene_type:complete